MERRCSNQRTAADSARTIMPSHRRPLDYPNEAATGIL